MSRIVCLSGLLRGGFPSWNGNTSSSVCRCVDFNDFTSIIAQTRRERGCKQDFQIQVPVSLKGPSINDVMQEGGRGGGGFTFHDQA